MLVLGLVGASGAGKDTAFMLLRDALPHRTVLRVAVADKVKAIADQLYGELGLEPVEYYNQHRAARSIKLPRIGKTPLELWCDVGDKARETYENILVDHLWLAIERLQQTHAPDIVCVTDVRYPNEAYSIQECGIPGIQGRLCKVINPRAIPLDTQADHALDGWRGQYEHQVLNAGSMLQFTESVQLLAEQLESRLTC